MIQKSAKLLQTCKSFHKIAAPALQQYANAKFVKTFCKFLQH